MTAVFHENWFDWPSQVALAQLAGDVEHLEGDIVEVGSWEGRSTIALANAAHPAVVHAVDTWAGAPSEPDQIATVAERDVHSLFLSNVEAATAGNVEAHRMDWRDYFAANDTKIRLLHIDGEHTYDQVADNIQAALPLMVPGGVICGDDYSHPPVRQAVHDVLGDVQVAATLWVWRTP